MVFLTTLGAEEPWQSQRRPYVLHNAAPVLFHTIGKIGRTLTKEEKLKKDLEIQRQMKATAKRFLTNYEMIPKVGSYSQPRTQY